MKHKSNPFRRSALLATALVISFGQSATAASATWNGTTDAIWATATNWSVTPVPGTGDTATFANAGGTVDVINLGTGVTVQNMVFDSSLAAAYTFGSGAVGSQKLTLDNGGAVTLNANVTKNQLFNSTVTLGTDGSTQTFTLTNLTTANTLTLAGAVSGSAGAGVKTLAIAGSGATTLSGVLSNGTGGTVALTKSGTGVLTLSGANTFTGTITVNGGTLKANNAAALGSNTVGTAVADGGTLDVNGLNLGTEVITLAGNGVSSNGALVSNGAADQINAVGRIILAANTKIGGTKRWDLRNTTPTLDMGGFTLTKTGANVVAIVGATISNPGNIVIDQGNLGIQTTTTLGGSASNTVTVNSGAIFENYQTATPQPWTLQLNDGSTYWAENGTGTQNTWSGPVIVAGATTLKVDGVLTISGNLSGSGTLNKTGNSVATLSGTNSFGGTTNVTAGTLVLARQNSLTEYQNVVVSGGATLAVMTGDGTTGWSEAQIDELRQAGVTWLTTDARLGFDTTNGNATYASLMDGAHSLVKLGSNSLTLTAANTLAGNVYSTAGTLVAGNPAAFGPAGKTVTFAGGGVEFATDTPVNSYLGNLGSGVTGSIIVNRATPGAGITHPMGVSTLGNGTLNILAGANVTSGSAVLGFEGINLTAGAAGTLTLNPTTANVAIIGPVNIGGNNFAKTLGLSGFSTGNVVSGVISNGLNTVSVNKSGSSTWTLTGANTYTGTTTVGGGTLILDYTAEDNSKLSDTAALSLAGGTLHLIGGTAPEVVLSTTLAAGTVSNVTAAPGAAVLQMNAITRNAGASVNFAADGIATTDTLNTNGILGSWATVGGSDWATNSTDAEDGPITTFTAYTLTSGAGNLAANYLDKNVSVDSSPVLDFDATFNSLRFHSPGTNTLTLTGINTITSGGILVTSAVGNNPLTITGGSLSGAAGGDLTITQNNPSANLTIASVIENNGTTNVVKLGVGAATLSGDNTYTGTTTVAGGTLTLSGAKTGNSGNLSVSTLPGISATLNLENGTYPLGTGQFNVGNAPNLAAVGTVNQSGGSVSFSGNSNQVLVGQNSVANHGIYNLSGGSITCPVNASRGIILGVNTGSYGGTFNLSGTGVLNMTLASGGTGDAALQVGRSDSVANNTTNVFNQTGGTANVGILMIGGNGGTGTGIASTVNLSGGVFAANQFTRFALGNANVAEINLSGTADVTLPAIPAGRGTGSTATFNFDGGTLRSSAASATYLNAPTLAYIKAGGANFNIANGRDIAIAQDLLTHPSSTGGGLTKAGPGKLALTGTSTYTGQTTITEGALSIGSPAALPGWNVAGKFSVASGASLGVYNTIGEAEIATLLATGNFMADSLLGFDTTLGDRTYPGSLGDTANGALGLDKLGANTLILSGPNAYTGLTRVRGGELRIAHPAAIGGANVVVSTGRLALEAGVSVPATKSVTINGDGANFFGALQTSTGDAEWQGNVIVGSVGARLGANASGIGTSTLKISGTVSSGELVSGLVIRNNTGGIVELAGANTYLGDTTVGFGTLRLSGGTNRLPIATKLLMGIANISGLLDLNGQNQEVAGVSVFQSSGTFTNEITSATAATLTVNTAATVPSTYTGKISGSVSIVKQGEDVLTLSGANTYTGDTTVAAGTLILTAPALADTSKLTIGLAVDSTAVLNLPNAGTDTVAGLIIDGVNQPVGIYDETNTNGAITGPGKIEVVVTQTPFEQWAATKITAINPSANATPTGDPDGDGRSNLVEFAFDGNPLSGVNDGKIVGKIASVEGSNVLTLTLPVRVGATFTGTAELVSNVTDGVTYTIQGSDNLVTWPLDIDEVTGLDAEAIKNTMPLLSSDAWTYRTFRTPDAVTTDATDYIRAKAE